MEGDDDQLAVVIAPDSAEEAGRWLTTLRAAGFHPSVDYSAVADRQGKFPVLVSPGEVDEARGFVRGLRASQAQQAQPAPTLTPSRTAPPPVTSPETVFVTQRPPATDWRWDRMAPLAGRAIALVTGLLVVAGGIAVLASMLQFLGSLRNH